DEQILFDSIPFAPVHDGSRLLITPDRKLLVSTGDAARGTLSQDHRSPNGKILRMNLDGSVPPDNPWASAPYPANYFWTTGHRNPQGLVLAANGLLYSSEHGPSNDDEVNIIERGRNYGWPNVQGYCNDSTELQIDTNERKFCADSNVI